VKTDLESALELSTNLLARRSAPLETELCSIGRRLAEPEKLSIVLLLAEKNVRLAADVGACIQLAIPQQVIWLEQLLRAGHANAIRQIVSKLFARRLGAARYLAVLRKQVAAHPASVHLAAYHFLGEAKGVDEQVRMALRELMEKTDPRSAPHLTRPDVP